MNKGNLQLALKYAGDSHNYQKLMILLLSILWLSINLVMMGQSYIYMDPIFACSSHEGVYISQNQACQIIDQCQLVHPSTLTATLKLYCNRQGERDVIQSVYAIGSVVGLVIMNFISDIKGRKISFSIALIALILGVSIEIIGGVYNIISLLIISQILNGFGSYSLITLSYILLADFCSNKIRQLGTILINSAWGFSTIGLGLFSLVEINWLILQVWALLIPLIITSILLLAFIVQSPYVLIRQNKKKQCLQSYAKICKINGTQNRLKEIEEILSQQVQRSDDNKASIRNVIFQLRKKENLKPILILILVHGCGCVLYYGLAYSLSFEGEGFAVNFLMAGVIEIISFTYLSLMVTKTPRIKGIAFFYTLTVMTGILFIFPSIRNDGVGSTVLLASNRFFESIAYTLLACIEIESFPVNIQSTAAGLIQAFATIGAILGPLVVDFARQVGIDPIFLLSIIMTFAIWPNFFLKQTLMPSLQSQEQSLQSLLLKKGSTQIIANSDSQIIYSSRSADNHHHNYNYKEDKLNDQSQLTDSILTTDD